MSKDLMFKIFGLVILFSAELCAIYSELMASRIGLHNTHILLKPVIIAMIAGIFLIVGYVVCYAYFKNIWVVAVISITSIFIIEPILARSMFHEMPTRGSMIGFGFALLGALSSIFL